MSHEPGWFLELSRGLLASRKLPQNVGRRSGSPGEARIEPLNFLFERFLNDRAGCKLPEAMDDLPLLEVGLQDGAALVVIKELVLAESVWILSLDRRMSAVRAILAVTPAVTDTVYCYAASQGYCQTGAHAGIGCMCSCNCMCCCCSSLCGLHVQL